MYGTNSILSYCKRLKLVRINSFVTHMSIDRALKHSMSKLETPGDVTHELLFFIMVSEDNM
jgi:hypothetical protein